MSTIEEYYCVTIYDYILLALNLVLFTDKQTIKCIDNIYYYFTLWKHSFKLILIWLLFVFIPLLI